MKKRACAALMALVMLLSLLPATAMAAGETEYTVGSAEDLTDAYEKIKGQSEDEATIILTADITTNSAKVGVEGKRVTFKSTEGNRFKLNATSLAGDCIFDTVDFAKKDNLAANGHYLELTENFTGEIQNIYGVKNYSSKGETIDKPIYMVLKGGSSDTITGTGSNISTTQDIHIVLDGHETENLRGGAATPAEDKPSVQGNITVEVLSGAVTDTLYGGMWGHGDYPINATVTGNVNVIIGEKGAPDKTATVANLEGGGYYCKINGNVNVTVNDGAYIRGNFYGFSSAGHGCEVSGTVTTTINGGIIPAPLYAGGLTHWDHYDGNNVKIGSKEAVEAGTAGDVVKLIINGGEVGNVGAYGNVSNFWDGYWNDPTNEDWYSQIYGNVLVEINGGTVNSIVMGYMYSKTWGDCTVVVNGGTIEATNAIRGDSSTDPLDEIDNYVLGDTNVIFNGVGTESYWGIGTVKAVNHVILENNTQVCGRTACLLNGVGSLTMEDGASLALRGGSASGDTVLGDCSFGDNTSLVMNRNYDEETGSATPALLSVGGTVTGEANLYTVNNGSEWTSGDGNTVVLSTPVAGEVYMNAAQCKETVRSGEEAEQLVLANLNANGLYVEYVQQGDTTRAASYPNSWRIAGTYTPPAEVLWYYEVYYQSDEDPDEWVLWKDGQGGWAAPDAAVSISQNDFNGTDLGWGEVLGEDYIFDEDNDNNRLSAPAGEATKDKPLKIYYKLAQQIAEDEIVVSPAPLTIYMGGTPYEGTVIDNSGALVSNSSSDAGFPEPGFTVELPEALEDVDVTDLLFEEEDGDRTWMFEPYDGNDDTEVYKLVPQGAGQKATRVQFTDPKTDKIVTSDDFEPGLHVNQTLEMSLYKGSGTTAVEDIIVKQGKVIYPVDSSPTADLTVRGTTDREQYAEVKDESGFTPTLDQPGLTAPSETTYTINDGEVQVKEGNVALLFDDILNHEGDDREELLIQRAEEKLTDTENTRSYEFKYLDLVDQNNGNVWVTASNNVTVYWPLPEGTDSETDFTLLHFEALDRQMDSENISSAITACQVEKINSFAVSGTHVSFSVEPGGFSPFALVWETEDSTQPDPGPDPDPDPDPEPDPGPEPDPDPDPVDVTVVKKWVLDDGGQAAESVTVELWYNNFYREDTVELSAANNWTCTWENLDGDRNWSVRETDVPEGFTATVERSGYTFTVINDDQAEVPDEPDDPDIPDEPDDPDIPDEPDDPDIPDEPDEPELPQTGMMWWPVWLLTAIGALLVLYGLIQWARCRRKHES